MSGDFTISNIELINLFKIYKLPLNQICSKNMLKGLPKQGNYIINMADEENPGTHWTCFIIRKTECMYFDSFGHIYPNDIKKFVNKNPNIKLYYNSDQIQNLDSTTCGIFCLAFIHFVHKHPSYGLPYALNMFNSQFVEVTKENDKILQTYIRQLK